MPSKTTVGLRRIAKNLKAQRNPCALCGKDIDYGLPPGHPRSFTVEHVKPRRRYPELAEDPNNCVAAHLDCNQLKSASEFEGLPLGTTSRDW